METDYPKMLYRDGSEIEFEGRGLDTITVEDADVEAAAKKEGFADLATVMKPKKAKAE
jgi:hypothetical protein